jgi:hypothetical protein
MHEKALDLAFAERLRSSEEFVGWLLDQTGFAAVAGDSRLLYREQIDARPHVDPRYWYRHWWCRLPGRKDSETDIFLTFGRTSIREQFALHIENKPPNAQFTPDQEVNYGLRAEFMANQPRFMNYQKWETVLLAPLLFRQVNSDRSARFNRFISYEEVSTFVPEFGLALREAGMSAA